MQHASRIPGVVGTAGLSLLIASSTAGLTGCSLADDMVMGLGSETETAHGRSASALPGPAEAVNDPNTLVVTPPQRHYLDALQAAGVQPSSDLAALRIGSYVCQARAAKHDERAVWDSVYPQVRGDVTDRHSSMAPSPLDVDALTSDYIRIATERLC